MATQKSLEMVKFLINYIQNQINARINSYTQ